MKNLVTFILLALPLLLQAQQVRTVLSGSDGENSFYDIERVGENEFWIAGENGILKTTDTNGVVKNFDFPTNGQNILRILNTNEFVYLATDHGTLYRYSKIDHHFIKKEFSGFRNKCFYDLVETSDGNIAACGGTSGISLGEKRIPRGFIAIFSPDLESYEVVYKSNRKFVWSMTEHNEKIYATVFNGISSEVIETADMHHWKKTAKVKGLIHELTSDGTQLFYSGTETINYKKHGIAGTLDSNSNHQKIKNSGCLWSSKKIGNTWVMVTQSGEVLQSDGISNIRRMLIPGAFTLYEIAKMSESRFMVSGHGGQLYFIDLNSETGTPGSL